MLPYSGMDLHLKPESGPQRPKQEKKLGKTGAIYGVTVGAIVGGLVFFIPSLYMEGNYTYFLTFVGALVGASQGAYLGPLIALRFAGSDGDRNGARRRIVTN